MRQKTLAFEWDVFILKHPEDQNPSFISRVKAVSAAQAVFRGAAMLNIRRYDLKGSTELTHPSRRPSSS